MALKTRKCIVVSAPFSSIHLSRCSLSMIKAYLANRILYAVSGSGAVVQLDDSGSPQTIKLKPGDWAFIPAYREHMEVNDGDEEFVCSIVRAPGGEPETVNLKDWKGVEK